MGRHSLPQPVDFGKSVFDLSGESMAHQAWFWWFWLFFFDNPSDPGRPRQLMVLWSAKDVNRISCNGKEFNFRLGQGGGVLDGVVASWYFDGLKMHHNLLLEQCKIRLEPLRLYSESADATSFSVGPGGSNVKIGERFDFSMESGRGHDFNRPTFVRDNILLDFSYSLLRFNRLNLRGVVDGEKVSGTAYFQRVFVNAPMPPWYWGIFHFQNGAVLTYFKPHFFEKGIRGDICLFDGERMHIFYSMDVVRVEGELPSFRVSGKNETEEISFTSVPYSHSSWTFRGRPLNLFQTELVYNEYPARIDDLLLKGRDGRQVLSSRELGGAVGNCEHSTGMLL